MGGLRNHLNNLENQIIGVDDDDYTIVGADDQTMTGMMGATGLNGEDEEDADGDEELDDGEGGSLT